MGLTLQDRHDQVMAEAAIFLNTGDWVGEVHQLQRVCGEISMAKGFDVDRPVAFKFDSPEAYQAATAHWLNTKLLLIVSEAVEAQEELRAGRTAQEFHYSTDSNGEAKLEGFGSEIADIVIRALHLAYVEDLDLAGIIREKLQYNIHRPMKHGKAF